ncbi:MAG TPA: 3',5'-nucleoside bisphosphate phosphatase [Hydrogenophaga sp.]|uniref:3',5'-nucleoside bisphosphate phosphatase n=1 Tax=Hydrogenophaga sp. TaxID=1904254 RepID=UPI002C795E9B|nr:3',5'-nucleoside bisphosphate phosphatase [Hydrogenophaga sp.]HMN93548.1 3',5'-nucleoside bisphosphate phosphatase [Hydrogenophaga sp.]HMP10263.1 3',5'-nucleoside bisphosphate phosphatase [Hydrogenophaga sp.]
MAGPVVRTGGAAYNHPVSHLLNADLHSHSLISDGTLTPEALALRASAQGVELWALTDHDELAGQARALEAACRLGLRYLTGTEISVSFAGTTVHIVGLGMDTEHPALVEGLRATRGGREARARAMSADLERAGIGGAYEGALRYVDNPELISRTHFARHLVDSGVCADTHEVFRRFLAEGKPGYVPHRWASLRDAVTWITGAGGVAVVAHPARYRLTTNEEYALFSEFRQLGGQAVEVVTAAHSQAETVKYADFCREFGLAASRGSDFHSPQESRIDLGQLPDLPGGVRPVWELLESRIH